VRLPGWVFVVPGFEVGDDSNYFEVSVMRRVQERAVEDLKFNFPTERVFVGKILAGQLAQGCQSGTVTIGVASCRYVRHLDRRPGVAENTEKLSEEQRGPRRV